MNSEVIPKHVDTAPPDDEISLLEIASVVLKRRRVILLTTFVSVLYAFVGAITTQLEYTATTSFLPNGGSQPAAIGLAQQFGLAIPRSGGAERSAQFYEDLIQSREILGSLVARGVEVITETGVTTIDLAEHFEIEGETDEARNARTRRRLEQEVISVSVSPETGVVTVALQTDTPALSAAIGRRLLELISRFDVETRQSQASEERSFAEERLGELQVESTIAEDSLQAFLVENRQFSNSPQLTFEHSRLQRIVDMRQELMTSMAQAYEQARIDEVRNTPVITVIDQPVPPVFPDARGRLRRLLLGLVLGLVAGVGLTLVLELADRAWKEESDASREFKSALRDTKRDLLGLRRSR